MFDGRRVGIAAALTLLLHAAPGAAQEAAHYRAVFDSLAQRLRAMRRAERLRDSLATASLRVDSVRAGAVVVLFDAAERERAAAAAGLVRTELERALDGDSAFAAARYYVAIAGAPQPVERLAGAQPVTYDSTATAADAARALVLRVAQQLAAALGPTLRDWVGPAVPLDTLDGRSLSSAYVELVSARTHLAGDCLAGDLAACASVLAVRPVQDPAARLFTARERRWLVAHWVADDRAEQRGCVSAGDDAACLALLRGSAGDGQEQLLRQANASLATARRTLLQVALRRGGRGAYGRLVAANASPAAALEAVAGVPLDTLLAGWRAAVVAARPRHGGLAAKRVAMSLAWVLALVLLVSRSSRWRRV